MKLYASFVYAPPQSVSGYLIHDSDSTQQVVLASPMPSDSNGIMHSRYWKRDIWERPRRAYIDGVWVDDSDFGDSNTLISSEYFWVSSIPTLSTSVLVEFDSYNYIDSETSTVFVCRLDSASAETGIDNMWKPVTFNFFMFQNQYGGAFSGGDDSLYSFQNILYEKFENWGNRDSLFDKPLGIDSALLDAVKSVTETFGSQAYISDSMLSDIDSNVSAGSWNDSTYYPGSLNKLGGVYDTLRNVNLVANLRSSSLFSIDSYGFADYTFDWHKDSSLWHSSKGPAIKGGYPSFYLRLEDSDFDPTDIETY